MNNHDIERQFLRNGGGDSVKETTARKKILDPRKAFLKRWNVGFVLSCVIAVLLDPLFFYLPVINEERRKDMSVSQIIQEVAFLMVNGQVHQPWRIKSMVIRGSGISEIKV